MAIRATDVSVVVPTYNEGERLLETLRSIAGQTVVPREVVVSDDGSEGDVADVVSRAVAEHSHLPIRLVAGFGNTGSGEARNRGIAAATGSWIASCDSDDVWLPTKLERQLELIHGWRGRRRLAVVGAWGSFVNDRLEPVSDAPMGPTTEEECAAIAQRGGLYFLLHSSALFRKADLVAVGGYSDEYPDSEDLWLWARLARLGSVVCVPEALVLYRKRPGSVQVTRFAVQHAGLERLALNEHRRVDGLPPLDPDAFAAARAAEPGWRRARRRLQVAGRRHYRVGAMQAVNGHRWRGMSRLAVALLLEPGRVRRGVGGFVRAHRRG